LFSEKLGRIVRNEPLVNLGVSSWIRIKEAIKEGLLEDALDLVDYLLTEGKRLHDLMSDWVYASLDFIAKNFGEEMLYEALHYSHQKLRKPYLEQISNFSVEDVVYLQAEGWRAHRSGPDALGEIEIYEKSDRYVISFNPCGSGGCMRRGGEIDDTPSRLGPPFNFGVTSKAYPWSWGKKGVPYYCLYCCICSEILPIEWIGYPTRISDYNPNHEEPCKFLFYKSPDMIPDIY
jgi:hypothetical protein